MVRRALLTGITGQDGSYLSELLLAKGYEVHGLVRDLGAARRGRLADILAAGHPRLHLQPGDLTSSASLERVVREVVPDEVYNLAAQSHVGLSYEQPARTGAVVALGTVRLIAALRAARVECRFYQASSSEIFGPAPFAHTEDSPPRPRSPYARAKLSAHLSTVCLREAHYWYAVCGIAFNHESPRRSARFVTRKISLAAAAISRGDADELRLGDLSPVRDWGHAPEYVEAMWRMLQREEPTDLVLATGEPRSVGDFAQAAFAHVGLDWRDHVRHDPRQLRLLEVDSMVGDPAKARELLGWKAETNADELARLMVDADLGGSRGLPEG